MKRGFEIACIVVAVGLTALFFLVGDGAQLLVMAIWIIVMITAAAVMLVAYLHSSARPPELRPQRFTLRRQGFVAPSPLDLRLVRGPLLLMLTGFGAMMVDAGNWFMLGVLAVPLATSVRNLRRTTVTLTPAGVTLGSGRTAAWGEPLQVPRELAVNPWFVSAAIQWYANHPDERPGIGTPEGHERLRSALGAVDPVMPPPPPLPRNLVLASWCTWAGVAAGVLSAIGDVVLTFVFQSALEQPDPVVLGSDDWVLIAGSTVFWLVVAVLAGLIALAVLHAVRRSRSEPARQWLAVLAGSAIAVALCPMGSPILTLADNDGVAGLIVLCGWSIGKAAVAGSAITTLALLMTAPVRAYTRVGGNLPA